MEIITINDIPTSATDKVCAMRVYQIVSSFKATECVINTDGETVTARSISGQRTGANQPVKRDDK